MTSPKRILLLLSLLFLACGDGAGQMVDVGTPVDRGVAKKDGPRKDTAVKKDRKVPLPDKKKPVKDKGKPKLDKGKPKLDKSKPKLDKGKPKPDLFKPKPDMKPCQDPGVTLDAGVRVWPTNLAVGGKATIIYPASGKLGSGSNLTLHYGANYWTLDMGGGSKNKTAGMVKQPGGGFKVTVNLPKGGKLLDFVFYRTSGGGKTWDNNNKNDWRRSVADPLLGPYLTLKDNFGGLGGVNRDPRNSMTVNFRSDRKCLGRVYWGTKAGALNTHVTQTGGATVDHHLHIPGILSPDTRYYYRVVCINPAAACKVEARSGVRSFRTMSNNTANLKVAVLADPQDNGLAGDKWAGVAAALTKPPHADARLVLVAGDLAGDDKPIRWWTFFHHGRELFATRPLLPVVGNHDTPTYGSHPDTTSFEKLFSLGSSSGTSTYWTLRYGPAQFIGLNSETAQSWVSKSDWKPGGKQYNWLSATLAKLPAASTWRFAAWHIPPYNAGTRHANQNQSTRGVTKLFGGKIDWVFGGHEHMYQRTRPVRYGGVNSAGVFGVKAAKYGRGGADGVGYLMAPGAGHYPAEGNLLKSSAPERALLAYPGAAQISGDKITPWVGFVMAEIKGKNLTLRAYQLGKATPRDQVTYTKP